MNKGVDVSEHNGLVDWRRLYHAGFDFAICRTGFGKSGLDPSFARNVYDATRAGFRCGAYHYSYALTPADASLEAQFCKRIIEEAGVLLELPVFFDIEDADGWKERHGFQFSRRNVTNICRTFLDFIKPLNAGVYASYSWFESFIDWRDLDCPIWNAQWGPYDFIQGFMWQYTDSLFIGDNKFDANILY
jgi:GH25 family lysozyme M1 (1,4-beta-N-acetylmuramidase)